MQAKDYLQYIVEKIHSTVFATVDGEGRPVTCAIDIMDYDESGLYFLTAKGKNFYDRLKAKSQPRRRGRTKTASFKAKAGKAAGMGRSPFPGKRAADRPFSPYDRREGLQTCPGFPLETKAQSCAYFTGRASGCMIEAWEVYGDDGQ